MRPPINEDLISSLMFLASLHLTFPFDLISNYENFPFSYAHFNMEKKIFGVHHSELPLTHGQLLVIITVVNIISEIIAKLNYILVTTT